MVDFNASETLSTQSVLDYEFSTKKASEIASVIKSGRRYYPSTYAKLLLEDYKIIRPVSSFKNIPASIKIHKATHHAYANIPVPLEALASTDVLLFVPIKTFDTEQEIKFYSDVKSGGVRKVKLVSCYFDLSINKPFSTAVLVTARSDQSEDIEIEDVSKFVNSCKEKNNKKNVLYKSQIIDSDTLEISPDFSKALYVNEDGDATELNFYKKRTVAFFTMGVGYSKETGYFKAVLPVSLFLREDLTKRKGEQFENYHKYILSSSGRFRVKYSDMFLMSMKNYITQYTILYSHASVTNGVNHTFEVLYPLKSLRKKTGYFSDFPKNVLDSAVQSIKNGMMKIENVPTINLDLSRNFKVKYGKEVEEEALLYEYLREQKKNDVYKHVNNSLHDTSG
ncbi:MAG TPA: hypothetical protein ENO30_03790 [Thermodesulfobium narugense]|nr:hypothetical protein [Thermodesulfobium narugense]